MDVAKFRMRKFSRSMRLESVGELQVRKKSANLTRSIFKFVVDFHISLRCRGGAANLTRSIFMFVVDFHIRPQSAKPTVPGRRRDAAAPGRPRAGAARPSASGPSDNMPAPLADGRRSAQGSAAQGRCCWG